MQTTTTQQLKKFLLHTLRMFRHLLPSTHQDDIQFHIKWTTKCLPCPIAYVVNVPDTWRQTTCCFLTQQTGTIATLMWKLSWTDGCLSYGLAKQEFTARPLQSPDDPSLIFSVQVCKRWGLHSASVYNLDQV